MRQRRTRKSKRRKRRMRIREDKIGRRDEIKEEEKTKGD